MNSKKYVTVTTSWDDGHKQDIKLASLLKKYGVQGTFYISPKDHEFSTKDRLTTAQIRHLAKEFEIGAHTMTHPQLPKLTLAQARDEIVSSKKTLEKIIGNRITSFCYPSGAYTTAIKQLVRDAGFHYARTVERFSITHVRGAFDASTTMHAYRHWSDAWTILRFAKFHPVHFVRFQWNWDTLAIAQFEAARRQNGTYHLWGHSWEIDKNKDWHRLERVLAHIASQQYVHFVTNNKLKTSKRPKLLMASAYFPPKVGGLERYAEVVAQGAIAKGYDVVILTSGSSRSIAIEQRTDGLKIYRVPTRMCVANTPVSLRWMRDIKYILAAEKPDLINVHMPVPVLPDIVVRQAGDIPVVVTYHSGSMRGRRLPLDIIAGAYETFVLPLVLKKAQGIIATSDATRQHFLHDYQDKTKTITPGVDTQLFRKRAKHTPGKNVLFVGNFSYNWKGSDILRAAIKRLPGVKLHMVGAGEQIRSTRTTYHGILQGEALVKRIQTSDVLVLPSISQSESFGMVLIEALACGVPVIGSDIGGIPTIISDQQTGWLIPPSDVTVLAKAITEALDNPRKAQRFAAAGRKKVLEQFAWDKIITAYLDELQNMTKVDA